MVKIKRRSLVKSLGAMSLSMAAAGLTGEELVSRHSIKNQEIDADVTIVGGGTAGVIAAIQAGRAGARTVLIESGSQLGGTTTTGGVAFPGIFHAWGKQIIGGIGWELVMDAVNLNGDLLPNFSLLPDRHWKHQVAVNTALYALLAEEKCLDAGVDVHYYETPHQIEFTDGHWIIDAVGKGTQTRIVSKQIIDCTGNALIASMAGLRVLREADVQPGSLIFRLEGYDYDALNLDEIPERYHRVLRQNKLENQIKTSREHTYVPYSYVYVPRADSTTSITHTRANQEGRKTLLKLLRELKTLPGCEQIRIQTMKTETAVRETYRIEGIYSMTRGDYVSGKVFEDSISHSFYPIDLHREGKSIYQEFLEPNVVASIPLRSLIPKDSKNILVAGRCVSSDRLANSALRVQASCMGMGQAAGVAAVLAAQRNATPAEVPINEIKRMLEEHGAIVPEFVG